MDIHKPKIMIGSDADGDMYYRVSGMLARMAKGSANTKLFMNAGATAPEWAVGLKLGAFSITTNTATGDVAYTGVGFKPSAVIFFACTNGGWSNTWSFGMDTGAARYCIFNYENVTPGSFPFSNVNSIYMVEASGKFYDGVIKTMDSDGFTITWTRTGATSVVDLRVAYLALR
jgi:hypothetical protein